jgi:predicted dehydrogenase
MFLQSVGTAGLVGAMPGSAFAAASGAVGHIRHEVATAPEIVVPEGQTVRFGVCGMSHDHIYGMVNAVIRGGGVLVSAWGLEPEKVANFRKRYPNCKIVATQKEVIEDPSLQLVLTSQIANERAGIGIAAMKHGKDVLSDKPGITTLEDLAAVRKTIAETGKMYNIMYSEMLEVPAAVKAAELVEQGAIGRVIQTINIAPHQIQQHGGDGGGAMARPDWFWVPEQYGGILCDIGSHQVYQFLYFTKSTKAEIPESQVANVAHPQHPRFQDFGDMVLRGDKGFGYVRLDWFTPDGLGTWGDGRLFILGTKGYIEVRKYTNVGESRKGNNLFIVDDKEARYIDCSQVPLPFGPAFVSDILHRTHTAQDQVQALYAAELVIKAQKQAKWVTLS